MDKFVDASGPLVGRRQFLLATGGLMLASPLALIGCGGASGGGSKKSSTAKVQVVLPSGSSLSLAGLTLLNGLAQVTLPASGVASTKVQADYPSFVVLTDANGGGVLFGFVNPGTRTSTIDAVSTATALLFIRIGGPTVSVKDKAQILSLIAAHPATADLTAVIETQVGGDPNAIQKGNAAIGQALESAHTQLLGSQNQAIARSVGRADPLPDLLVQPTGLQSGFEVLQEESSVAVRGTNNYRRRCQLYLYRTAETGSTGAVNTYSQAVPVGNALPVDGTAALGLFSTVEGLLSGDTAFVPVTTPQIFMSLQPDSTRTDFEVVVLGASGNAEPSFFNEAKYSAVVADWRTVIKRLNVTEAIFDVALGYILELWGIRSFFKSDAVVTALYEGLYKIEDVTMKTLLQRAEAGAYSDVIYDMVQLTATSDIVSKGVRDALRPYVSLLEQDAIDAAARNLPQRTLALGLRMINAAFAVVNVGLAAGDLAAVAHDLGVSNPGERWTATLVKPTLILSPKTASIRAGSRQTFNVTPPAGLTGTFLYAWSQTSAFATLSAADGKVGNSIETSSTSVDLVTTGSDTTPITVTVVGYQVGTGGVRTEFGHATATVSLSGSSTGDLTITPFTSGLLSNPDGFGNMRHSVVAWQFLAFDLLPKPSEGFTIQKITGTDANGGPAYTSVGYIPYSDITGQSVPVLTLDGLLNGTYQHYANSQQGVGANQFNTVYFYNLGDGKVGIGYQSASEHDEPSQNIVLGYGELLAKVNADLGTATSPYRLIRS